MNDTDRTSVALLYHENIVDVLKHLNKQESIPFTTKFWKIFVFLTI